MKFPIGRFSGVPLEMPNRRLTQPTTYDILTAPTSLPVTLTQVKTQLVITNNLQDEFLILLIETARDCFESITGRILINTEFRTFRSFITQSYELRKSKLQTLNAFQFLNEENVWTDFDADLFYVTFENTYSRIIIPEINLIPVDKIDTIQSIRVDFVAGFGDTDVDVPSDIKMGLLNHIAQMYANRGDCSTCDTSGAIPATAKLIYNKYKILSLFGANYREGV